MKVVLICALLFVSGVAVLWYGQMRTERALMDLNTTLKEQGAWEKNRRDKEAQIRLGENAIRDHHEKIQVLDERFYRAIREHDFKEADEIKKQLTAERERVNRG